jgi:hypothetical protein
MGECSGIAQLKENSDDPAFLCWEILSLIERNMRHGGYWQVTSDAETVSRK